MMHLLFCVIALSGFLYHYFKKRVFDFFSVAYFGSLLYFLPGFLGFVLDLEGLNNIQGIVMRDILSYIPAEAYAIMIFVLLAQIVSVICFDRKARTPCLEQKSATPADHPEYLAAALAFLGCVFTIVTVGSRLVTIDKFTMLQSLNRWTILWEVCANIGLVLAVRNRNRAAFSICFLLLLADVAIGFRVNIILSLLAVSVYTLSSQGAFQIARKSGILALGFLSVVVAFFYRGLNQFLRMGDFARAYSMLTDPLYYFRETLFSEPFIIQTTLNEVVKRHFHVGPSALGSTIYTLIPFSNDLGATIIGFDDLFQPRLFPSLDWGMAGNIWAESWSVAGWIGVTVCLAVFVAGVWWGSVLLRSCNALGRCFAVLVFCPWAFYIHRNDSLFQIIMERRIAVFFMICIFGTSFFRSLMAFAVPKAWSLVGPRGG